MLSDERVCTLVYLDLPETMAVRVKLLPESGLISQIAMSAMDNWGDEIKEKNVPVLVIIEGLTMYLSEADVQRIFAVISGRFQQATVFVEIMNPMIVSGSRKNPLMPATQNLCGVRKMALPLQNLCRIFNLGKSTA